MTKKANSGYFGVSKSGGADKYTGPSGRHFDLAQVQLFYARGGKFPGQKAKSVKAGWKAAAHQRDTHHATAGKSL